MKRGFPLGEHFVELMFNLCIRFNTFKLGDPEKALFSALVLISPGMNPNLYISLFSITFAVHFWIPSLSKRDLYLPTSYKSKSFFTGEFLSMSLLLIFFSWEGFPVHSLTRSFSLMKVSFFNKRWIQKGSTCMCLGFH